ncbi:hypothetical protein NW768_002696 [Fusarium equiseti]|uniref:Uncharacterized protein n=1 Tax=Fusarium equiseti TaxID=61235 RepID=A0ABQ8RJW9_FUSEQ|nr:hypothetical protein NW768_002696 [Fusarium equiseti]
MDDTLALTFYRKASNLIPDLLVMDSIESAQVFLLFGIYVLPTDPAGLSCTYFGIAIKAPLFRSNVHLNLTYHLFHILIGRSYILDEFDVKAKEAPASEWLRLRKAMADDCVKSAVATINLCQLLKEENSLSKSSYTEFSSCCAAILVLVAKYVSDKSKQVQGARKTGLGLLREISTGVFSTSSEKCAVAALEAASDKLNLHANEEARSVKLLEDGYRQFRGWVATRHIVSEELQLPRQENQILNVLRGSPLGSQCSEMLGDNVDGALPDYTELVFLPDLEEWFNYGVEH